MSENRIRMTARATFAAGEGRTTDSGLIFAAYQRDPARQFVPVQERLAAADALNRWITTIGSATFAILPGVLAAGGCLGQPLLESH
jgi:dye decolorizing peroxidase